MLGCLSVAITLPIMVVGVFLSALWIGILLLFNILTLPIRILYALFGIND